MNEQRCGPTDLDLLRYAVAVGAGGANLLQGAVCGSTEVGPSAWALLVTALEAISAELLSLIGGEDGLDEPYSTGHPVVSMLTFDDCECVWVHTFHPDPANSRNAPQELTVLTCPRGGQHRVVIKQLGVIGVATDEK